MKKCLLGICLLIGVAFFVTGCGSDITGNGSDGGLFSSTKTVTCTREEVDEEGFKTKDEMIVTYDSSKVLSAKSISIIETDPTLVEFTLSFGNLLSDAINVVEGVSVSYEKYGDSSIKATTNIDYEKLDYSKLKSQLGDMYDSDDDALYNVKGLSFEEFKKKSLAGYSCK
jgi:hypothetical protein